jgi:hypothetical protein
MGSITRKKGRLASVQLDTDYVADAEVAAFLQINRDHGMTVHGKPRRGLLPDCDREADQANGATGTRVRDEDDDKDIRNRKIVDVYRGEIARGVQKTATVGTLTERFSLSKAQIYRILAKSKAKD